MFPVLVLLISHMNTLGSGGLVPYILSLGTRLDPFIVQLICVTELEEYYQFLNSSSSIPMLFLFSYVQTECRNF